MSSEELTAAATKALALLKKMTSLEADLARRFKLGEVILELGNALGVTEQGDIEGAKQHAEYLALHREVSRFFDVGPSIGLGVWMAMSDVSRIGIAQVILGYAGQIEQEKDRLRQERARQREEAELERQRDAAGAGSW